jgi:hypothetical protein
VSSSRHKFYCHKVYSPSSLSTALGLTKPLTEMTTRNLPGGKGRPMHKADTLTAICEPIVYRKSGNLDVLTLWASTACFRDSFLIISVIVITPITMAARSDGRHGCLYAFVLSCVRPCVRLIPRPASPNDSLQNCETKCFTDAVYCRWEQQETDSNYTSRNNNHAL